MCMTVERKRRRRKRRWMDDEGELTDEVRQEIEEAEQEMALGEYVAYEEVMAKYG